MDKKEAQSGLMVFVGGISVDVEASDLIKYFSHFGEVKNARIIINKRFNRSKGYGFVTMASHRAIKQIFSTQHFLSGRKIDVQESALVAQDTRVNDYKKNRLLVSSLPLETTDKELENCFQKFGSIRICYVLQDQSVPLSTRLGCVEYQNKEDSKKVLNFKEIYFKGRKVQISLFSDKKDIQEKLAAIENSNNRVSQDVAGKNNTPLSFVQYRNNVKQNILITSRKINENPSNYLFRVRSMNLAEASASGFKNPTLLKSKKKLRGALTNSGSYVSRGASTATNNYLRNLPELTPPNQNSVVGNFWSHSVAAIHAKRYSAYSTPKHLIRDVQPVSEV